MKCYNCYQAPQCHRSFGLLSLRFTSSAAHLIQKFELSTLVVLTSYGLNSRYLNHLNHFDHLELFVLFWSSITAYNIIGAILNLSICFLTPLVNFQISSNFWIILQLNKFWRKSDKIENLELTLLTHLGLISTSSWFLWCLILLLEPPESKVRKFPFLELYSHADISRLSFLDLALTLCS